MIPGRIGFNMLAMTFDIILYRTLHNAISRNFDSVFASSSFGIRVMKVELRDFRMDEEHRESSTTSQTFVLIIS